MGSFLLIAFLLPLLAVVLQAATDAPFIQWVLYGIQAASPSIAAIVLLAKSKTYKTFLKEMFHREHLAAAMIFPTVTACTAMAGAKLIFCALTRSAFALSGISPAQFVVIAWALVAEEIGWRGYFEPLLRAAGLAPRVVPLIVGITWGLWHYHYFLVGNLQAPIFWFFAGCIVESYLYSFFMQLTEQNLISAMIYHFSWNCGIHLFAINPAGNHGSQYPYILLIILEALTLLLVNAIKRREKRYV